MIKPHPLEKGFPQGVLIPSQHLKFPAVPAPQCPLRKKNVSELIRPSGGKSSTTEDKAPLSQVILALLFRTTDGMQGLIYCSRWLHWFFWWTDYYSLQQNSQIKSGTGSGWFCLWNASQVHLFLVLLPLLLCGPSLCNTSNILRYPP